MWVCWVEPPRLLSITLLSNSMRYCATSWRRCHADYKTLKSFKLSRVNLTVHSESAITSVNPIHLSLTCSKCGKAAQNSYVLSTQVTAKADLRPVERLRCRHCRSQFRLQPNTITCSGTGTRYTLQMDPNENTACRGEVHMRLNAFISSAACLGPCKGRMTST